MALAGHDQPAEEQWTGSSGPLAVDDGQGAAHSSPSTAHYSGAAINWRALLLMAAALGWAALGQYYFANRREFLADGVLFYTVGVICFVLALRLLQPIAEQRTTTDAQRRLYPSLALRPSSLAGQWLLPLAGIACGALAAYLANRDENAPSYWLPFGLWVIGWATFTGAFAPGIRPANRQEVRLRLQAWTVSHRLELAVIGGIMLLALLVRVVSLETIPVNLGGDEGTQGVWALDAMTGKLKNMFATGWFDMPTLQFFIIGAFLRLAGASIATLRLPYALLATLSVLWTYLLVHDLWRDRWLAALAAFLLAVANYHIHFSRLGSAQILDTFFITLVLWLYVRAERSGNLLTYALGGLALGFSNFFYYGARIIGIILGVYILYRAVAGWRKAAKGGLLRPPSSALLGLLVMVVAAGLVVAPLGLYYSHHPQALTSRTMAVSIIQPGWFEREMAYWKMSQAQLIGEQIRKSLTGFNYYPDPTYWYHPGRPLLDAISAVLLVFGVVYGLTQLRQRPYWLVVTWFFLAITFGWVLTENPPSSMRMLVATPAVAILVAVGFQQLFRLVRDTWQGLGVALWAAVPLALFVIAYLNLNFYFRQYTPTGVYGYTSSKIATPLARALQQHHDNYEVYMFSGGEVYWGDNGVLRYLLYGVPGMDVKEPLTGQPTFVDRSRAAVFVFLPSRRNELQQVRQAFPQGRLRDFTAPDGQFLFTLYEVDQG